MDKETQLWNLLERLREEILQADSINYQIMGIIIAATAAIFTAAFTQADPLARLFMFLGIYIVTVPGYRLLQGNRRRTWRISTYIRAFVEPQLKFVKWETRLSNQSQLRKYNKSSQLFSSLVTTNEWLIMFLLNSIAGGATVIFGLFQTGLDSRVKNVGVFLVILWNLYLMISTLWQENDLRRGGKIEENYYQSWLKVQQNENSQ